MFCSRTINNKINRIQERALRLVYLDYTCSFVDLLKMDNSVTIHQRNIRLVAIEMFKVLRGLGPEILRNLFSIDHTSETRSFFRPNVSSKYNGENSLRYFGPVVWDSMLPDKLKSIQILEKFKMEVKKWVPTNCPCTLCKEYIAGVGFVDTFE